MGKAINDEVLLALAKKGGGGGGGTDDYTDLSHKPQVNGHTLEGNKTTSDLGIRFQDLPDAPTIPNDLADLQDDSTHRLVTDTEKATWNGSSIIKNLDNGMLSHSTDSDYITVNLDVPLTAGKEYKITIRDAQYNYIDTKQILWTSDVDVIFPGVRSSGEYKISLTQATVSLYNYGGTGWRDIYCDIVSNYVPIAQSDWNESDNTKEDYIKNKPTLGTASAKNVPASGDASSSQVVMGNDSRLTDSRPASDVSSWAKQSTKPTYTASEVGAIATTQKGVASGVAELDANGKVPSSQLPSYVDDVIEGYYDTITDRFYTESTFENVIPPESGKSWVDVASNKSYRWTGSVYSRVDEGVQLGETSGSAYRGDRGKIAYDHSQTTGNPHGTTFSDLTNKPENSNTFQGTIAEWNQLTTAEKKAYDHASIPDSLDGNVTFPASKVMMLDGASVESALASAVPRTASGTTLAQLASAIGQLSESQRDTCKIGITRSGTRFALSRLFDDMYGTAFKYTSNVQTTTWYFKVSDVKFYSFENNAQSTYDASATVTSWTLYYQGTPIS